MSDFPGNPHKKPFSLEEQCCTEVRHKPLLEKRKQYSNHNPETQPRLVARVQPPSHCQNTQQQF